MHNRARVPFLIPALAAALSLGSSCAVPEAPMAPVQVYADGKAPPPEIHPAAYYWATGGAQGIQPDGRLPVSVEGVATSAYHDGDCAVEARINLTNAGDSRFDPGSAWRRSSVCSDGIAARRLARVAFPASTGWAAENIGYLYVRRLYYFDNGSTDPLYANWRNTMDIGTSGACGSIHFNATRYPGSSNLLIQRMTIDGKSAYRIRSDSSRNHLAWCSNRAVAVSVPFTLFVQDKAP